MLPLDGGRVLSLPPRPRLLLIASTGGHLAQLCRIATLVDASEDSTWLTFDAPQSRSLLAQWRDVHYVPYVKPRDFGGVLRTLVYSRRLVRTNRYDSVISTGAGVALVLPFLRASGLRAIYVESVSRVQGPSLTGRVLAAWPWIERRSQHRHWSSRRWPFEFTLLEQFCRRSIDQPRPDRPLRIFVTLGTIQPYRFDDALQAVQDLCRADDKVVWQVGVSTGLSLQGLQHETMPRELFIKCALEADVVVTHAGVGTVLDLFELGIFPIVLPRRAANGEHVDDHQQQIANELQGRGLGLVKLPHQLNRADLLLAAQSAISPGSSEGA